MWKLWVINIKVLRLIIELEWLNNLERLIELKRLSLFSYKFIGCFIIVRMIFVVFIFIDMPLFSRSEEWILRQFQLRYIILCFSMLYLIILKPLTNHSTLPLILLLKHVLIIKYIKITLTINITNIKNRLILIIKWLIMIGYLNVWFYIKSRGIVLIDWILLLTNQTFV